MPRLNLRDDQWKRIADLLPGKPGDRGRTAGDNRLFVEAVLWMARSGAPWRDLPEEFGLWNSVYKRFARWEKSGVWERVFGALAGDADFQRIAELEARLAKDSHNSSKPPSSIPPFRKPPPHSQRKA